MHKRFAAVVTVLMAMGLSACINLAPRRPQPAVELPTAWGAVATEATAIETGATWWHHFEDATLNRLIDEALAHNAELAIAVARIDEARAELGFARATQGPTLDATFGGARTHSSIATTYAFPPGAREYDTFRGGLNVAYELDFWQRLRNTRRAARADLLATQAAAATVRMSLSVLVAQTYFAIGTLEAQLADARRSVATREAGLKLQALRFEVGAISEFEYRQLEGDVLSAKAQLPALERERERQLTALAVLLGRSAREIFAAAPLFEAPPAIDAEATEAPAAPGLAVPSGLPSALLLRRPDLVAAEQRMLAANARIGAARAAYFPSLALTGIYGSESAVLRDLFSGPALMWNVAANLTQPIWGGGRAGARVDAMHARERQALLQYEQAIRNAFADVRNALGAQAHAREQLLIETERSAALRKTLKLAKLRYENGIASQLDVLDTERALLAAELSRHEAVRAQRAAVADLFKALGGGW